MQKITTTTSPNKNDGSGCAVIVTQAAAIEERYEEWKSAYARYYETQFVPAGHAAVNEEDGPLLAAAFPNCDKTVHARTTVRSSAWLLDLLAEHVASARPCRCDRAVDVEPICACVRDAAAAFQAATGEFNGDRRRRSDDGTDDQKRSARHENTAQVHFKKSEFL